MTYDEEEYFIPLEDQRVFGAGIKRKRVQFVPAVEPNLSTTTSKPDKAASSSSVGDTYLSIVLKRSKSEPIEKNTDSTLDENKKHEVTPSDSRERATRTDSSNDKTSPTPETAPETRSSSQSLPDSNCEICHLPLRTTSNLSPTAHHSSIAHQVCLEHSHPPSHIDRARSGLKYLSSYGWDPDSRRGLGARGEGIRQPLKGKIKNDTVGLGVSEALLATKKKGERDPPPLNAKEVRKREAEGRKKGERLREMFYRNDDVEKYLGGG
jgi:hypothetical protein